jgi:hypothetical protein
MAVDLYLNVVVYAFDSVPISFSFKIAVARVGCPSCERFSVKQSDPCFLLRIGETMNRGDGNEKGS